MMSVNRFQELYCELNRNTLHLLDVLYSEDVVFIDPLHELRGLTDVRQYFHNMYTNVQELHLDFGDHFTDGDRAMVSWRMHFRHPRLGGGKLLSFDGISHLRFDRNVERIAYHRDYYDAGQMLYEHVPLLGGLIRVLKRRVAP